MWAAQLPPLRMGLQPLLLLLLLATSLVSPTRVQDAEPRPVFLIDSVKLKVLPGHNVGSGTNVTLQCVPKITSGTGKAPSYQSIFYRDGDLVFTQNSTTASLLHIPGARVANSGSYSCVVSGYGMRKESKSETLSVTGLQTPVLILNKSFVTEGEEVTVSCSAPEELGKFFFYFYEESKEVTKVQASTNWAKAPLIFSSQGNKSLHCDYVVVLHPGSMRSNQSKTVNVFVQELSIRPSIEIQPSTNVIEGDILNITCKVIGSLYESVNVYVSKDNKLLQTGLGRSVFSKKMLSDDSGTYECKLQMGNLLKTVNSSVVVSELFSKPVLTMHPKEVFEKEPFSLACNSLNISTLRIQENNVKYSIFKNGKILTLGTFHGKYNRRADTSLNGNYTCYAVAHMIRKTSNTIVFKAKVLVSKPLMKVSGNVIVGKNLSIQCHCENGSLPISYTLLNKKVPVHPVMTVWQPNDTALFNVTIRRKEDIKNFTCEAENNGYSSKKESDVLNVTVIEPVSKPNLLIMPYLGDVTEGEDLYLQCTVKDGSPPITFEWYRDGLDQPLYSTKSKGRSESYRLGRATSNHSSSYHCKADNQAKEEMLSKAGTINVRLARWKKILIGVFCIVLLVSLIGFGCYRYRVKRGKRESATELSVKPSSPKSEDSLTVSLAHSTEVYNADKDSGDARGRSVWSERESHSDNDEQSSEEAPKEPDVEYTEVVHPQPADSSRDVTDHSGYGSVEYAQLNHDLPEPVEAV
ncbi:platelet endothelial cell adhesion molecule isoform X4 [Conger conger]|uniref:platelet endothelial cell adhesion molecule isoform X4 n=1 Tax=Conger conger TaxID=82655 RepID=UPI002A5AF539|nr:platelet endothelial cell adhesion molecule isoform X4 [Conger conger]